MKERWERLVSGVKVEAVLTSQPLQRATAPAVQGKGGEEGAETGNGTCTAVAREGLQVNQAAGIALLLCIFKDGSTMAFFVCCQLVTARNNPLRSNLRPRTHRT